MTETGAFPAPCPGCLDTAECWVCLGSGAQDTRSGIGLCASCEGTRTCRYCAPGREEAAAS